MPTGLVPSQAVQLGAVHRGGPPDQSEGPATAAAPLEAPTVRPPPPRRGEGGWDAVAVAADPAEDSSVCNADKSSSQKRAKSQ